MENRDNVISFEQGYAKRNRPFWKFSYPHQLITDATLDLEEKRAILAAWASDEHSVESLPTLRHLPGTPFPVTFSSIMGAMMALDRMCGRNGDDPQPPKAPAASRRAALSAA